MEYEEGIVGNSDVSELVFHVRLIDALLSLCVVFERWRWMTDSGPVRHIRPQVQGQLVHSHATLSAAG